ncbi:MAG: hypothetical protein RIC12_01310, partial [Pirellulales bacterium]
RTEFGNSIRAEAVCRQDDNPDVLDHRLAVRWRLDLQDISSRFLCRLLLPLRLGPPLQQR